jgi:hypothetical protein
MRYGGALRLIAILVGSVATMTVAVPCAEAADPQCIPFHVRLDLSIWNTSRPADLGRSIAQTFLAEDTLITGITVWLPPDHPTAFGAHLYVTDVDETNGRPNTDQILLDGPTVHVNNDVPPGQFIEMPFVLDPPLALPRPGMYAFFLRTEFCSPASWSIVASNANPYPYGLYWLTGRVDNPPCHLRPVAGGENNTDLLFDIEFCTTRVPAARAGTWGELKVLYR